MLKLSMMSSTAGRVPAEKVIEIAKFSGLKGIEWINSHGSNGKELRKLVEKSGLKTVAYTMYDETFVNRESNYLDKFKEHLEIAVDAGAPHLMIPPFARINSKGLAEDRKEWTEYFAEVYPFAKAAGMTLTLESTGLPDSPIVKADEILEVLEAVPGLKVVFDNGNTFTADEPFSAYRKLLPWIIHVHMKDSSVLDSPCDRAILRRNGKYMRAALIGDGDLDLCGFLSLLESTGYDRWITLETSDPERIIPIQDALKTVAERVNCWEQEGFVCKKR